MGNVYKRGAKWRKWDLHFHTPSSHDYKDNSVNDEDIINILAENNISVVAITDHHTMNIDRIKKLQKLGENKGITVLPGIEFLSDARGDKPIHFIGIFSENCKLSHIWGQIKNRTAISKIEGESKKINEVYCDLTDTAKLIHELGGIVTIHAGSKSNSIENITNSLLHAIAQKEDIAQVTDFFELGKEKDEDEYKKIVIPHLIKNINKTHPLIICSDNHNVRDFKLKQTCWIKADPTFEGLKQILNEPKDRVFIGEKPEILERVANNRTKYIKELKISSVDGYDGKYGKWFENISIPLNKELIAIIGNKGSGKSAVADIISLCSNYYNDKDFSFLTSEKFREKSGKIAKNFKATLVWESEHEDTKGLNDVPDDTNLKGIKYIPQGQFERLTNEISTASEFQKEIEKVVFSHISDSERLGANSFTELIEKKKHTFETELVSLYTEIETLNSQIINLEEKNTGVYKKEIENKLKKKEDELNALVEPPIVSNPNEDPEKKKQSEAIISRIDKLKTELETLETQKKEKEEKKKDLLIDLQTFKDTRKEIELKVAEIERFISEKKDVLSEFDLDFDKLISIKTDFSELDKHISDKEEILKNVKISLGEISEKDEKSKDNKKNINQQIEEKNKNLKDEQSKLDAEQKKYQEYLSAKKIWETEKSKIIGDENTSETIKFYQKEKEYLEKKLKDNLNELYKLRKNIVRNIFQKKQNVISIYKDAKSRINEIIEENAATLKDYKVDIAASLVKHSDFNSRFFSYINHNKMGTYYTIEGAEKKFHEIISDINFDEEESVINLLDKLRDSLLFDRRDGQKNAERLVVEQVNNVSSLYNYLFKLEFIDYNYQLKQGDKGIEQLSPGERGALLLVFYLLLDKDDKPLIIDQPEDNLDNLSVAKVLVPFIRAAKKKRQIIMVTHNPNLAVVSDAEQVIYVQLDKDNSYTFSATSGSIENKEVNKKIVEVLEGAMPAFNKRKDKYYD